MTRKERYKAVVELFKKINPDAETELEYNDPFQLLIAVILSAQCTDERINKVTPALFENFPSPEHLAVVSAEEVFPFIKSVTYPNNKSKHLAGMAKMLVEDFNSEVPGDLVDLQKLPRSDKINGSEGFTRIGFLGLSDLKNCFYGRRNKQYKAKNFSC